jgi:hypothetical protein
MMSNCYIPAPSDPRVIMENDQESRPVACSLGRADLAQRAQRWDDLATRALSQAARTPHGLRLVFGAGPGVADELQALVGLERGCCGFATWSVRSSEGQVTLEVSADSAEAVTAVRSMFASLG